MKLNDIIKTKKIIEDMGYSIENNIIEFVEINTIAHFGNCTCFEIICSNVCPMSSYNNTKNLGYLMRAFIELMGLSEEDGIRIRDIENVPCRIILTGRGTVGDKCVGIGHFMKDKFVFIEDLVKVDE